MTITITGSNDAPSLTVGDPDGLLYESGVGRDTTTSDHRPFDKPGQPEENNPYDNDAAGTASVTGSINAADVDHGDILHFAVADGTGMTAPEGLGLTAGSQTSVTAQGHYGQLVVTETANGTASYTYTLHGNSDGIPLTFPVTVNGTTYAGLEELKQGLDWDFDGQPTLDNLPEGATVSESFTIFVQDDKGAWQQQEVSFTITGTNDQPEVTLDADSELGLIESGVGRTDDGQVVTAPGTEEENQAYDGSHADDKGTQQLEGKVTGADVDAGHKLWFGAVAGDKSQDGSWEGAQSPDADIFLGKDATDGDVESSEPVEGSFGHLVLNSDGTWTYTLKGEGETVQGTASLDGETFDISSIDALPEGATITDTFTIYVKDEHGAWNLETVTITITGSNDKPSLEIRDGNGQILTDGAVLETIESDPADADDATSWPQLSGSFDIRDVDADAGSDQTILIAGGTHTDGDVEHATSPAAGHEPQPGHIGSEGGTQAIFTTDYGTLTVNPDGSWTYVVNSGSELVQQLDPEHPHFETFEITVVDEHGAYDTREIVIKVEGSSAFPVITDKDDLVFKEEGVYHDGSDGNTPTEAGDVVDGQGNVIPGHHQTESLSGRVDATDIDLGDQGNLSFRVDAADAQLKTDGTPAVTQPEAPKQVSTSPNGDTVYESGYGTLTFHADGTYTYELKSGAFDADGNAVNKLAQGEVLTETFTVTVRDTFGKEVSTDITITIHGTNDKPRLELGDGSDDGALHVTESGVGRHDDGAVVDGPDDELVGAPSKDGTAADEIGRYDGALTDSDKATGKDADHGAELVYGVEAGKAESPDGVDFTTDGGDVSVRGQYGSLTIGADGSYSYTLDESSDFTAGDGTQYDRLDYLNESETLTETFTIFVRDEHGAWASKEVTVTVTGTNDRPTLDVLDGKKFFDASGKEIAVADDRLHAYGTADSAANAVVRLSGRVQASDDDRENGAGQETTDGDNHGLQFSLQGTGYDPALTSSSVWKDGSGHDLGTGPVDVSRSGDGGYVATTEYGTLTLDQYGNYTYELHEGDDDVTALGKGESVTETFVVRVVDDRGAWSEKTITITIEGTDDKPVLSDDTESVLDVYEAGVWGSKRGATDPDGTFTGGNTGSQEITVSFDKQDANDTHSLVIGEGLSLGIKQPLDVTSPDGTTVVNATYTITQTADGIYTLTAIIPGVSNGEIITLGTLKLQQDGTDDELTYTFTPDQDGLNGLPQDMDLSIDIPLQVEDQNGNRSDGEHTATINIHGTNDRPTIEVTRPAPEDVYADGVGREDDGSAVATPDKTELNPEENAPYGSRPVEGQLTASDVDAGDTTFSYFVDKVGGISDSALTATVGDGKTTVTLSLNGVAVAELTLDSATGKYSLSLLDTDEARAALAPYGEDVKFDFTVYFNVRDEHGSTAQTSASQKFSIHGTNDAPEIKDASDLGLDEGMVSVAGQVSAEDADAGHKLTYGLLDTDAYDRLTNQNGPQSVDMTTSLSNKFGTLKIDPATGKYTFYLDAESEAVISLPEGLEKKLTFHVAVRDDKGAWDVKDITVTITGKDTATVFVGDAAVVSSVVEAGVVPDTYPQKENQSEDGSPVASGKLEAKDYDTVDGRPNEVEYSINTTENGQMPTTSAFSKLRPEIQDAISQQFPEEAWGADADIQIMQGQYGTLYLNTSTGQYFYQLDNDSDATNALKRGEIRYDDFSIHAQGTGKGDAQGADQPLKVAVKGSNDAPEVTGVTLDKGQDGLAVSDDGFTVTGIVEDGGTETVTGRIGATDVDSPDRSTAGEGSVLKYLIKVTGEDGSVRYVGAQSGEYGYLKLNEKTGEYTFVFNNKAAQHLGAGDIGEASFTVVVLDEYNAISEEKKLTFEITGKDDAPRISGSAASITEDTGNSVNIQPVTITDPDTRDEQHITSIASRGGEPVELTGNGPWKTEGEYGTLTVTRNEDGSLSYTYQLTEEGRNKLQYLNEDGAHTSVQENFTVTGDSGGQSVTGGITVTINGVNDAPTLELRAPDGQAVSEEHPVEVKDWKPVKGTAVGDDVDDAEGDLRYSVDDADSATAAQDGLQTIKGKFGYLTINAETGEYTYVVDPFSEAYRELQTGTQGKEHFTITVTDPYGATGTKEIVFDVTKVEGGTGPGTVELQEPEDPTNVIEDGGDYDVILPPSVASDFTELKDSEGKPVKVDADDIWLVDNKGQSGIVDGDMTHVVQTEYGSLILEKGDDGQWGYRFVLNNSSDIVQSLDEGDSIEKTFYVSAGTNQVPIHVTITGINDQPVIESVGHLSIEDTGGIVTGRVTTTDPDAGDVGSNEAGEGSEQNLSYAVSEGSGITLTPTSGQEKGAPGTYTLTKDGTDWGEFTLNKDGSYSFKPSAEAEKLLAGENANFNLTITVDDGSDAPNSSTGENLHITITGTNEAPVIKGGKLTLEATEDTAITVGDKLDVSDDRVNEGNLSYSVAAGEGAASSNAGNMAAGQYGTLFINADGTYSYQLNNQMQAVQELGEDSEPLKETFTIFVKDQDGAEVAKTVTVTINGTNDAPVLSLDTPVLTIKEGSTAEVGGTASATDVDKGDTLSYALKDGTLSEETGKYVCKTDYGTFSIAPVTGEYRFVLDNSLDAVKNLRPTDVVDAKVTVVVDDGHGGVTEKELTVHIKGSDSVPEITDEGSLAIDVAEEPESTAEKDIAAEGWDHGPDGTHDDPLHYAAQGAQPVTIDGQVWQMVTGKYGTLYLDPKTGKYRYELTEDMNHLADGETATESFGKITIADSTGNKITETITVTIKGSNDAPEIAVSQPSGALAGTVTITDVDASDTHSVTFEGLCADAAGTPLSVDLATLEQEGGTTTVDVYDADGTLIGKLELVYTKGTGTDDSLAYTFTPDEGYLNSLPVNRSQDIDFSITVSDTHDGTDTTDGLQFGVSNVNDAPVIDETLSQGPAEGSNTGTLAFTDADVRDVHSVTFDGLQDANGHALTVDNVEGLTGDREVPVYRDGLQIGTLTLSYADGKLSYTLSTEGFEDNLPVGESSIGFDLTVTDAQGSSDQLGGLQFGVSNVNDAPVIDETLSQGPAEGSNTGTLAFTDADVRDVHSVTFDGLQDANGHALTVDNVEGLTGDREVPVYRDGLQIGTLTLSYADGKLSYTLSTEGFEDNLPVGESSIGFDLTVTDAQGSSDTAEDLQFRVTGNGTTGGGIPAGEDDAALRAQSERQRLAAEESGLLTAAASFVAGITPESADPETFLQDTVPAQENGPEALVAEEIPLPQDETVLQEEMTDLPDADVPVSKTPLADDLLAEPLLFAGLENADEMPEPVEMLRFETTEDMLPAEDADPATAATPPAFSGEEAGDGGLLLPEGVEGLFGTDGDDYLRGGEGSDAIFGGAGNDIIVYDQQDYLVSGGSGIDFMVSDDTSLTLDGLLSNTSSDKPLVSGIEVLLKGEDALSLTSINDLADRYGITLGVNEAGEETLQLDDRWTKQDDGSYDFNGGAEADGGLTLETSLTPVETGDPASEAVQQQVFTLEHSNG
ncbi:VCBS domain-containing protein [Desulfovibrio sp.]|uniref:VCBS domain-containing protein n=1 Tax=Desulfovibrio sp. TaxID=885 RepID=UPI003076A60A